jgi:hypothetical protein
MQKSWPSWNNSPLMNETLLRRWIPRSWCSLQN